MGREDWSVTWEIAPENTETGLTAGFAACFRRSRGEVLEQYRHVLVVSNSGSLTASDGECRHANRFGIRHS